MLFAQLGQNKFFQSLVISFAVVLRAPAVDSQKVSLSCTDFVRNQITNCICRVKTSPEVLTTTTTTITTTTTSSTTTDSGEKDETRKCSEDERNSAYITIGDEPDIQKGSPYLGSASSRCVCCYKDFLKKERFSGIRYPTPDSTCKVKRSLRGVEVINASFLLKGKLLKFKYVYCVLPCLPGKTNVTVRFVDEPVVGAKSLSTLILIVAGSVGGIIALAMISLVLTYFIVQHQRKQAWVIYENKPTRPAPLPTVQNSGLIYIVNPRGLVLPLLERSPEETEGSETAPGQAGTKSKRKRSSDRRSLAANAQENEDKDLDNISLPVV